MAFLDKLTEAGQKTIARTKEFADTSRLHSLISDEEKTINAQYLQIGKMYVEKHPGDYDPDYDVMIRKIVESKKNIEDYNKQIQDMKRVQRCPQCGAEVPVGAAFCNACGARMPAPQVQVPVNNATDMITCPKCGSQVRKGMRFCTTCGFNLQQAQSSPAPQPAPVPQQVSQAPVPPVTPVPEPVPQNTPESDSIKLDAPEKDAQEAPRMEVHRQSEPEKVDIPEVKLTEEDLEDIPTPPPVPAPAPTPVQPAPQIAPQVMFCRNCGAKLEPDAVFCTECGFKVK